MLDGLNGRCLGGPIKAYERCQELCPIRSILIMIHVRRQDQLVATRLSSSNFASRTMNAIPVHARPLTPIGRSMD